MSKGPHGLSQELDYLGLVSDGVVVTSNGIHMAAWEFSGFDMDAVPFAESYQLADRLGRHLGLGPGWSIQTDLVKEEVTEYITDQGYWQSAGAKLIDEERRARFLDQVGKNATRASRYFFCLSYDPKQRGLRGMTGKAMGVKDDSQNQDSGAILSRFLAKVDEVQGLLRGSVQDVERLKGYLLPVGEIEQHCDRCLEYIRYCISHKWFPFAVPESGIDLNQYLAVDNFTGGAEMQLGDPEDEVLPGEHVVVLAVDSFPEYSFAGILRALDGVPCNFRFTQQALIRDEIESAKEHKANASKWAKKGAGGLKSEFKPAQVHQLDTTALSLSGDAALAASEAEHGKEFFVHYSGKIVIMNRSLEVVRESADMLRTALRRCGFNCRAESLNGTSAWLGSLPAQQYKDVRHFTINTRNLAHMMPLSKPFLGKKYNPSQYFPHQSPPLMMGLTAGGAPYRFHAQSADLGHVLVVGPSGAGKTTVIALAMASTQRFDGSQCYSFDKKRSLYMATMALGGKFEELSAESETKLCPLAYLKTDKQMQWAEQYVAFLVELNGLTVTPDIRNDIGRALFLLSRSPSHHSLTALQGACSLPALKSALQFYLNTILDGDRDELEVSRFVTFEMDELYSLDARIMNGALFYIFGRIRARLDSSVPTFIFADEFRTALSHPIAAAAFDNFLSEGRKLNLSVWLVVQEMSQTFASALKSTILEQTPTKIALPNPQASLEGREYYKAMGFSEVDMAAISGAIPKSHYYVAKPEGKRMVSFEMGPVFLALICSSDDDRRRFKALLETHGISEAVACWLEFKGLPQWAARHRVLAPSFQQKGIALYA